MRKRLPDLTTHRYLISIAGQTARRRRRSKLLQPPLDFLYESRFENEHGFFGPIIKEIVGRYFDCGNPRCEFSRIRCPDCHAEHLLMFSCRTRGFYPSSHAKRLEEWGEWSPRAISCKVYEVDPMICPQCGGQMKFISFLTDYAVFDKMIDHLKLTFSRRDPPLYPSPIKNT